MQGVDHLVQHRTLTFCASKRVAHRGNLLSQCRQISRVGPAQLRYNCLQASKDADMTLISKWEQPYTDGPLTREEFSQYWTKGYVVKHNVLTQDQLQPVLKSIERLVDNLAQKLYRAGKIKDLHEDADVYTRLIRLEAEFPDASVLIHKDGRMPLEVAHLWSSPSLLAIAKQLLGPLVAGHPNWNLRSKTPRQEQATVPWHQDSAYADSDSWETLQVTAWVPLLDATVQNGCMQMVQGGHLSGKTAKHWGAVGGTWYVAMDEDDAVRQLGVDLSQDVVTCEMPMGSILLFNNLIPHRSLENHSNKIRWSLDLRWQRPGEPHGNYGTKEPILLCDPRQPDYVVDWGHWLNIDKKSGTERPPDLMAGDADPDDELSTILVGPWLDNWPIVHENRHTRAWQEVKQKLGLKDRDREAAPQVQVEA